MYNKLRFFKGTDYDLNLVKNANGVWTGSIYFDEVSTSLYETINLFIVEEVRHNGEVAFSTPIAESNTLTFDFEWNDTSYTSSDIIMYNAKLEGGQTLVNVLKTQSMTVLDSTLITGTTSNDIKEVSSFSDVAFQVNLALKSEVENRHQRVLNVYANDGTTKTLIAQITLYGETVGEDERLRSLLENFGATLDETDFLLFKDHDISEMAPDHILLNRKRKELLLELSNIKPFIGTYKAILNAIDFFGYNNITLKEYWINVDTTSKSFGKMHAIPVPNSSEWGDAVRKTISVEVPSSTMKKTSRFSLVYKLNTPTGEVDEWDIPKVEEVYDYTPDEVLIKLYGLKKKLQREYLPLNAKIVDIIGEGDFFAQKNQNIWSNQNPIAFFSEGHDIKFTYFPQNRPLFIEDHALVLGTTIDQDVDTVKYERLLDTQFGQFEDLTSSDLTDMREAYTEFYNTYYDRDLSTFNQDEPVGCPILLDGNKSFDQIWDDAQFTWQDAMDSNQNLSVTWNNWWKRWVYEIEWIVTGPRGYSETFRGPIDDYVLFPISLPYVGSYSVEMRTYDLFGHRSYDKVADMIDVKVKQVELYGIYKWKDDTSWNSSSTKWNKSGGYWDMPITNKTTVDEAIGTLYLTMDRANYAHDESSGTRFSTVRRYVDVFSPEGYSETAGPYQWNELAFSWNDTEHNWWDATRVGSDIAASFEILDTINGDILTISSLQGYNLLTSTHTITSATPSGLSDITGWQAIADELNASSDPIISKFNYNLNLFDSNNDGTADTFINILAVGKESSRTYDFESVSLVSGEIGNQIHHKIYNPTFDDTRTFRNFAEVERSTHVTISTDITKMPGIKNPKWTITNNTNPGANDIYYDDMWLTYIFQTPGNYTIGLEVEDTNGNKNVVQRNMLKVN